jgi:intein-encoded DNA endonuclease-like protein
MSSRTFTLIDDRLQQRTGTGLADTITQLAKTQSLRQIAKHITDTTGIPVSHETVRQWQTTETTNT